MTFFSFVSGRPTRRAFRIHLPGRRVLHRLPVQVRVRKRRGRHRIGNQSELRLEQGSERTEAAGAVVRALSDDLVSQALRRFGRYRKPIRPVLFPPPPGPQTQPRLTISRTERQEDADRHPAEDRNASRGRTGSDPDQIPRNGIVEHERAERIFNDIAKDSLRDQANEARP